MLHITNGEAVARTLEQAGVGGEVSISADLLHEGPCLTGASPAEFREARARYLAEAGCAAYDEALERLVHEDAALHAARAQDEVVLWFEHDLFDQLQLLRLLAWFERHGTGDATCSAGSRPGAGTSSVDWQWVWSDPTHCPSGRGVEESWIRGPRVGAH